MSRSNSVRVRVFLYLLISQPIATLLAWGVMVALLLMRADADFELADLAHVRVSQMVVASMARAPDGRLAIIPNEALKRLTAETPSVTYAVFDSASGAALPGSSPEIVSAFAQITGLKTRYVDFSLVGAGESLRGACTKLETPFGLFYVATHGYRFQPSDIVYYFSDNLQQVSPYLLASVAAATLASWFAITRGLASLQQISDRAALIDMNSLSQGLPVESVPREILPLVSAMNGALARVDASVARMRRFTANAAHELRTPIAIMRARLESAGGLPPKGDLLRDATRLQAIVEQMLISTRLTEQQAQLDQTINLVEALSEIVADYTPLAIECDRSIDFDAPSTPVLIRGNRQAIECVVSNLIGNALRAEPSGGAVLVTLSDTSEIAVIDHGAGVPKEERELIFEPFWRRSDAPGLGLGLAIGKELIEKHEGRIWVEDTPGGGATFRIAFQGEASRA